MQLVQIIAIIGSVVLFVFVIDFIRRNLLKEKYAVLWLTLSAVVTILSLWKSLLDKLAHIVGVAYAPSLLFFIAFIFVLLILLHFSVVISIFHDKNKTMIQDLTMLKGAVEDLTERVDKDTRKKATSAGQRPKRVFIKPTKGGKGTKKARAKAKAERG